MYVFLRTLVSASCDITHDRGSMIYHRRNKAHDLLRVLCSASCDITHETRGTIGNGFLKRSGLYKIDKFRACGVPSISAVPQPGNPGKSTGALEVASGKGAASTKSTNFGLLWGSVHFGGPRSQKSRKIHRGLGNGFRKRSGLYKNRQILGFCGVPSISAVREEKPEIQQIHRGLGNGFRKRSGLYKIDKFWAFVGFPPFRRSQKPEIQQIHGALEMAS